MPYVHVKVNTLNVVLVTPRNAVSLFICAGKLRDQA